MKRPCWSGLRKLFFGLRVYHEKGRPAAAAEVVTRRVKARDEALQRWKELLKKV
jgi:hypothetical protein